jgi:hypothetical protein
MERNELLAAALYGTDADKETSLFEYGLLVAPYTKDGNTDEFFCVYRIGDGLFDTGYIREYELNNLINGQDWASAEDIESFLSTYDITKSDWLELNFVHKLSDCLGHWGYENIMGSSYTDGVTTQQAKELYF